MSGKVGEVAVWNPPLTTDEIQIYFNSTKQKYGMDWTVLEFDVAEIEADIPSLEEVKESRRWKSKRMLRPESEV